MEKILSIVFCPNPLPPTPGHYCLVELFGEKMGGGNPWKIFSFFVCFLYSLIPVLSSHVLHGRENILIVHKYVQEHVSCIRVLILRRKEEMLLKVILKMLLVSDILTGILLIML